MSARGKGGCGCSGGGGSTGCSCGESCGCCTREGASCTPGPFERPLFFGGQLLTEDDLQQLVEYVVAKNRLHNRALFGDGVVCGLQVTCDPCGGAKITVHPGYALDCCGNDIVVECSTTLDINQMIRDLRRKRLGKDCGDPCKDVKDDCSNQPTTPTTTVIEAPAAGAVPLYRRLGEGCKDVATEPERKHVEEYCLYVRYCETPAAPVAPYATDDCTPSSCQPTRTREGYEFELRCKTVEKPERTIIDTFGDCLGDLTVLRSMAAKAALLHRTFDAVAVGAGRALSEKPIEFSKEDQAALDHASEALRMRIDAKTPPSEAEIIDGIHTLVEVGALTARSHLAKVDEEKRIPKRAAQPALIREAVDYYKSHLDRISEPFARALAQEATTYFETPIERHLESDPLQARALANGALIGNSMLLAAVDPARDLYNTLRERLARKNLTHCSLADKVARMPPPRYEKSELHFEQALAFSRQVSELTELLIEYELECFCDALNPPCADCDDPAVLLACLEWKDCKVIDICNVERKWVITGPNLRYWIPWIGQLGEVWEEVCCPDPCDYQKRGAHVSMMERMIAPAVAPGLHEVVRMLGRIPAHPATYLAPPPAAPPTAATGAEWKSLLEDTQARVDALHAQNEELTARLERLEARKK